MIDITAVWEFVRTGGLPAMLFLVIVTGAMEWWVYGWRYREMKAERDLFMQMAIRGTQTAESFKSAPHL